MYYYKARIYHPVLGRFMQTDPIGYGDGMNWYAYVQGDPVNMTDPTGLAGDTRGGPDGTIEEIIIRGRKRESQENAQLAAFAYNFYSGYKNYGPAGSFVGCVGGALGYDSKCSFGQWGWAIGEGALDVFGGYAEKTAAKFVLKLGVKYGPDVLAFVAKLRKANCGCFVAGTLVATPTGLVAIEDIKVGDLVLAYDEKTAAISVKPVTDLIRPEPKATYLVELKSVGGETETIRATADHPWFTAGHQWVATEALKASDVIETATGTDFHIASISFQAKLVQTYNLTVADHHTFLVGNNHLVVHNAICWPALKKTLNQIESSIFRGQAPKSVDRIDKLTSGGGFPGEIPQIHFKDGAALNIDGTWKHSPRALTNKEVKWLKSIGWGLPE